MNKNAVIIFLLLFATVQFILILRHKSPYISDTFFYQHKFYQLRGYTPQESYQKIISQVDLAKLDQTTARMLATFDSFNQTNEFFQRRLLYPLLVHLLNSFSRQEYLSFLLPIFLSYLGIVFLSYQLARVSQPPIFAALAGSMVVAFYPLLDWSTYFLTDTIGAFLWLLLIYFVYRYLTSPSPKLLKLYAVFLIIAFLNREQTLLLVPALLLFSLLLKIFKLRQVLTRIGSVVLITIITSVIYLVVSTFWSTKSVLDNLAYMINNFTPTTNYNFAAITTYLWQSFINSHVVLFFDITRHHWWFVITALGLTGIIRTLLAKKPHPLDLLMISQGLASYLMILWPFLSYRFLIPAIIAVIYFSTKLLLEYFSKQEVK